MVKKIKSVDLKYKDFLIKKTNMGASSGFDPLFVPDYLFDF